MQTMLWVLYIYFFITFSLLVIFLVIMSIQKTEKDKHLSELHLPDKEQNSLNINDEGTTVYTTGNTEHTGAIEYTENTDIPDESTDDF